MQDDNSQQETPAETPQEYPKRKKFRFSCLGCLGMFVVGFVLMIAVGYYSLLHTSLPLGIVQDMLESSGDVKIDGLTGSLSSGFHAGKITMSSDAAHPDKVSILKNVEFRFNGVGAFFKDEPRLIISEFSVASGTLYLDFHSAVTSGTGPSDGDGEAKVDQPDVPADNSGGNTSSDSHNGAPKEIRIDLVQFTDMKFIDINTGAESKLGRFTMKDFQYLDGKVRNIGEYELEGLSLMTEQFQLQNLSGTPETGFHLDRIAVRNQRDEWSQVEQLTLEFNGLNDAIANRRLVIERFTAESGVFYISPDQWTASTEPPVSEIAKNDTTRVNAKSPLTEFAIQNIELSDFKFINSDTRLEFAIQEISVRDFQFIDQRLTRLGDIGIRADHLEFHSEPGTRFSDSAGVLNKRFSGVLGAQMHERLLQDITFDMTYCVLEDGTSQSHLTMFGGGLEFEQTSTKIVTTWHNFSLTDFLVWDEGLIPANVNGAWTVQLDPLSTAASRLTVAADSTMELGSHLFKVTETEFNLDDNADHSPAIPFQATIGEDQVTCQVRILKDNPFIALELEGTDNDIREQFSRIFFEARFADLTDIQQSQISKNLKATKASLKPEALNSPESNP